MIKFRLFPESVKYQFIQIAEYVFHAFPAGKVVAA
jgi:hypothetical protein